jgi:CubicO group peptidase (beta-lactamase class C family)
MSSGIGDFFGERYESTSKEKLNSVADYLPLFADKPLEFEPGAQKRYSNGGYIVLGAIIQKVSGMDYYGYVRTNLFQPAGMLRSDSFAKTFSNSDIAVGYTRKTKSGQAAVGLIRNDWMLPQRGSSAGGGYSTARDLLKYTQALPQGNLGPATFESRNGLSISGGTEGVNAVVDWHPKSGYTVVVLANYDPPSAEKVGHQIRAWLPEMDSTKPPMARK